jgi:multidrug efflux system membrane fusion protein
MGKTGKSGIAVAMAVLVAAGAGYFALDQMAQDRARASAASSSLSAIPVTADKAVTRDMPMFVRGIGTVQAYKSVTVKTRVDGQIVKVLFDEGQDVKTGDTLFQIDPRPFQAALDQALATKQRDEAQLSGAQLDLERYGKLVGPGFQSRQSYDQQKATVDALKGSIAADDAAIETARVNLGYTDIRAPIDGRTGQRLVDLGNIVQAGQATSLVTITQIKPIYVNFTVPQEATEGIRHNQAVAPLEVRAYGSDDKTLLAEGKLTLIDNQIDQATGTLRLKATFDNADERLWPGQFVNVRLVISTRRNAVTVPEGTVMQGADGYYAYVVKADNTVERRTVVLDGTQDGLAVVSRGIDIGEQVVVDGQYRLTNGARVRVDASPKGEPNSHPQPEAAPARQPQGQGQPQSAQPPAPHGNSG